MNFRINDYKLLQTNYDPSREVIDYGVRMVGAPLEWGETMGEGIKVGIIDTGIDSDHFELKNRIKDGINTCAGGSLDNIEDENGHGTHISGIVAAEKNGKGVVGVAPKADLYIAKAFDSEGTSNFEAIEKSILWMIDKNVDVVNMSFSSAAGGRAYTELIHKLYINGTSVICAAGNEGEQGENTIGYPAKFKETVAVSAVDINKNIADFSSKGSSAELCAAGINIYSTYLNGGFALLSGTSMAAPIITGAVAILHGKGMLRYGRRLTPDEIRLLLNIYTEDLSGGRGRDKSYGYGFFSFGRIGLNDYVIDEIKKKYRPAYSGRDIVSAAIAIIASGL